MGSWKLTLFIIVLGISIIVSGCSLLPEPASLIEPPKEAKTISNDDDNMISVAKKHLPKRTELLISNAPVGSEPVLIGDLDGDGHNEEVVLFYSKDQTDKVGFFILKNEENNRKKIYAKKLSGTEISWASLTDITGDGIKELLIGWRAGVFGRNVLEIFSWQNGHLKVINKINYDELEEIEIKGEQKTRLAIWKKDFADNYDIQLLKWEENKFVNDFANCPTYFAKVADYYKKRTEEVPEAAYYWYGLAKAQYKANQINDALISINHGMKLKVVAPSYEEFMKLREEIIAKKKSDRDNKHVKMTSLEDKLIIQHISTSVEKYLHVMSGGKQSEGIIDSFTLNEMDYRYLGVNINTKAKFIHYLSPSYTIEAIQTFMKRAKIVEHNGKLSQPNADLGSLLNYQGAIIIQKAGNSNEKNFDLKVPLGDSELYEIIHVVFQRTEHGWRISTEPGTF